MACAEAATRRLGEAGYSTREIGAIAGHRTLGGSSAVPARSNKRSLQLQRWSGYQNRRRTKFPNTPHGLGMNGVIIAPRFGLEAQFQGGCAYAARDDDGPAAAGLERDRLRGRSLSRRTSGIPDRRRWHPSLRLCPVARAHRPAGERTGGARRQPGDRVATLAWNGYRHFELYYAIAGIGAVCHTINPRLFPEQIT